VPVLHQLRRRQYTVLTKGQILQQCASKGKTARITSRCIVTNLSRQGVDYSQHGCALTCLNVVQTVLRSPCEGTQTVQETGICASKSDDFLSLIAHVALLTCINTTHLTHAQSICKTTIGRLINSPPKYQSQGPLSTGLSREHRLAGRIAKSRSPAI
jgi:hypothetical protein